MVVVPFFFTPFFVLLTSLEGVVRIPSHYRALYEGVDSLESPANLFMCAYSPDTMSRGQSKQITVRFDLKDWIQVLQEAELEGIKPVQFIRSTILKRLNGTLVDVRGIDAYIKQRDRDDMLGNRRQL